MKYFVSSNWTRYRQTRNSMEMSSNDYAKKVVGFNESLVNPLNPYPLIPQPTMENFYHVLIYLLL